MPFSHEFSLRALAVAIAGASLTLLVAPPCHAANEVSLSWNLNQEPGVVGYKIHLGVAQGEHTQVVDAGLSNTATLMDLEEGVNYYTALTAYNVLGLESSKSEELAFIIETTNTASFLVIVEPETGVPSGAMALGFELNESLQPSVGFVEAQDSPNPGQLTMSFDTPANGEYFAWALVKTANESDDTLGIGVGANAPLVIEHELIPAGMAHTTDWMWVPIESSPGVFRGFNLSAGPQQLILNKVDTNILIERMVFFSDPGFDPSSYDFSQQDLVIISEQPLSQEAAFGSSVTMGVSVISTSNLSYQWYKDGNPIQNAQTQTLLLQSSQLNDSGAYQVEIQSENSTVMSTSANLVVSPPLPTTPFAVRSFELTVVGNTPTVVFDAVGFENSRIQVQVSPDLIEWEDLGASVIPTGPISVEDSGAASASERYYRLLLTPLN